MSNYNIDLNYLANKVKNRVDIVEEAEREGLHLKRYGRNYKMRCPFHSEHTPSFTISREKQIFKCFGCGIGGDVISLIAKLTNRSNRDIIIQYAEYLGIIDHGNINRNQRLEMQQQARQREFIKQHQKKFNAVFILLSDMMHGFKRSMSKARNMQEVIMAHELYRVYDVIP